MQIFIYFYIKFNTKISSSVDFRLIQSKRLEIRLAIQLAG